MIMVVVSVEDGPERDFSLFYFAQDWSRLRGIDDCRVVRLLAHNQIGVVVPQEGNLDDSHGSRASSIFLFFSLPEIVTGLPDLYQLKN